MDRICGVIIPACVLALLGALLAYAGLGFDHQVIVRWVTTTDSPHLYVRKAAGTYHHGAEGIALLAVFLGFVWVVLACGAAAFMRWAWKGYPGAY